MIVVSNTSPITNLAAIGRFDLLRALFEQVHIAEGVWRELNHEGHEHPGSREVAEAPWVLRHAVRNQPLVTALERDLDRGEAETLALGLELKADLVLLDEKEARHAAARMSLRHVGVLGLLIESKRRGFVPRVAPLLFALRHEAGFYLGEGLIREVLAAADEGP